MTLNAALENESHDGADNNTRATAQSLEPSFLTFNASVNSSQSSAYPGRGAVLGTLEASTLAVIDSDDFESGGLDGQWTTFSDHPEGRIQATGSFGTAGGSFALLMDIEPGPFPVLNLNEAIWTVDLSGQTQATLQFAHRNFSDETNFLPSDFGGHSNGDGVAISDDGVNWHTVVNAGDLTSSDWQTFKVDLAAEAAAAGMTLGAGFQIKFQQWDNFPLTTDGRGYDEIVLGIPVRAEDFHSFSLKAGESVTLALNGSADLELQNAAGTTLATASGGAANIDQVISDFVASAPGTYYARVSSAADTASDYSLLVTRNSEFDTEKNDTLATAQGLVSTQVAGRAWALGALTAGRTITLDYVDSGWWNSFGEHEATNDNYFVGQVPDEYRNFFVFDLAGVSGLIVDAQLRLTNPFGGFSSTDPTEIYSLFDVSTPISALSASGFGDTGIFDDLGTGATLGSQTVSFADDGQIVSVSLGQAGLSSLNAAEGGLFALGGALTTLAGGAVEQFLFGFSGQPDNVRQLVLTLADMSDVYRVTADALKTLEVQTLTPASKNGEVVNALDPMVRIYNAAGVLVASDDNSLPDGRNAKVSYKVPKGAGGTYYIEVIPSTATTQPTQGEYILSVKGSSTLPSGSPLLAASTPTGKAAKGNLTTAAARPLLQEALRRWKLAGFDTSVLGKLDIRVVDLDGRTLGFASGKTIYLDVNAAGWGWFVDRTVRSDGEFDKAGNQGEQGRIDLLTVLMHEVGHLLGQEHSLDGIMLDTLGTGVRRKPGSAVL